MRVVNRRTVSVLLSAAAVLAAPAAHAVRFDIGDITGSVNTVMTAGVGVRTEGRSVNNVGKANFNPGVCGGNEQSCQDVFKDQIHPAMTLFEAPGAASINNDAGDWNYNKGKL